MAIAVMRVIIWLYPTNRPPPALGAARRPPAPRRAGVGGIPALLYLAAAAAPTVSLLIYASAPLLYFLSITVLRQGRARNQEYADFT